MVDSEIELLHFSTWDDTYPSTLRWSVKVSGTEENLIVGYDPRGIIEVKPIPEDKRVDVEVSYFDLEDDSKPKDPKVIGLEEEMRLKDERLEAQDKELDKLNKKDEDYDIRNATSYDVMMGTVRVYSGYALITGTGTYIGNHRVRGDGNQREWHSRYYGEKDSNTEFNALILTNNHVAAHTASVDIIVTEDKQAMFIMLPATPYVRYTGDSERFGTPAALLYLDGEPMLAPGIDSGLLVTTPISYLKAPVLGNSDNVKNGDTVISVGCPMGLIKTMTQGIVSNTDLNMYKSWDYGWPYIDWIRNASFMIDTTQGIGGQSGSSVWAIDGKESGKIVALRNSGLAVWHSDYRCSELIELDDIDMQLLPRKLIKIDDKNVVGLLGGLDKIEFTSSIGELEGFMDAVKFQDGYTAVAGMNFGIAINKVKGWMVERGIDLGFKLDDKHFK